MPVAKKTAHPVRGTDAEDSEPVGLLPEVLAFACTLPTNLAGLVSAIHSPDALRCGTPGVDPLAFARAIEEQAEAVTLGSLEGVERSLVAQSIALQSIFTELSVKAARKGDVEEKAAYYGLALRAQAQANATLKTLIELKQPRQAVFAKSAAVNQGEGPQQVVMGASGASRTHAREDRISPNELEAQEEGHGGTPLDAGAARPAIGNRASGQALAIVHRASNPRGKSRVAR